MHNLKTNNYEYLPNVLALSVILFMVDYFLIIKPVDVQLL